MLKGKEHSSNSSDRPNSAPSVFGGFPSLSAPSSLQTTNSNGLQSCGDGHEKSLTWTLPNTSSSFFSYSTMATISSMNQAVSYHSCLHRRLPPITNKNSNTDEEKRSIPAATRSSSSNASGDSSCVQSSDLSHDSSGVSSSKTSPLIRRGQNSFFNHGQGPIKAFALTQSVAIAVAETEEKQAHTQKIEAEEKPELKAAESTRCQGTTQDPKVLYVNAKLELLYKLQQEKERQKEERKERRRLQSLCLTPKCASNDY